MKFKIAIRKVPSWLIWLGGFVKYFIFLYGFLYICLDIYTYYKR